MVQAFAQNTRDEVRIIGGDGEIAGALAAQPGMKQTTYVAIGLNGGDYIVTPFDTTQITSPHNYSSPKEGDPCHPLAAGAHPPAIAYPINSMNAFRSPNAAASTGLGVGHVGEAMYTLTKGSHHAVVIGFDAYNNDVTGNVSKTIDTGQDYHHVPNVFAYRSGDNGQDAAADISPIIRKGGDGGGNPPAIAAFQPTADCLTAAYGTKWNGNASATNGSLFAGTKSAIRRLTPVECERLQGFPDNFTAIPWKKKEPEDCPDGPRYKALGNSMAVPVMRWIGERIQLVDDFISLF